MASGKSEVPIEVIRSTINEVMAANFAKTQEMNLVATGQWMAAVASINAKIDSLGAAGVKRVAKKAPAEGAEAGAVGVETSAKKVPNNIMTWFKNEAKTNTDFRASINQKAWTRAEEMHADKKGQTKWLNAVVDAAWNILKGPEFAEYVANLRKAHEAAKANAAAAVKLETVEATTPPPEVAAAAKPRKTRAKAVAAAAGPAPVTIADLTPKTAKSKKQPVAAPVQQLADELSDDDENMDDMDELGEDDDDIGDDD